MADGTGPFGFSKADASRVARSTRYVERMYRNPPPAPTTSGFPWNPGIMPGTVGTSNIAAGLSGDVTLDAGSQVVQAKNIFSSTATASSRCIVGWSAGQWYLVSWNC